MQHWWDKGCLLLEETVAFEDPLIFLKERFVNCKERHGGWVIGTFAEKTPGCLFWQKIIRQVLVWLSVFLFEASLLRGKLPGTLGTYRYTPVPAIRGLVVCSLILSDIRDKIRDNIFSVNACTGYPGIGILITDPKGTIIQQ